MHFEVMVSRLQSEALRLCDTGHRLEDAAGIMGSVCRELNRSDDEGLIFAGIRLKEQLEGIYRLARKADTLGKGLDKIALLYLGNEISIEDMVKENVWRVPGERDAEGNILMTPVYDGLASDPGHRPELIDTGEGIGREAEEAASAIILKG